MSGYNYFGAGYFGGSDLSGSTDTINNSVYLLDGIQIPNPHQVTTIKIKQIIENRVLVGAVNRNFFGDSKKQWELLYHNISVTKYILLQSIYSDYLANGIMTLEITGNNYFVDITNVHIDLPNRAIPGSGINYLSDVIINLKEA